MKNPMCDRKGIYGEVRNLPCLSCIKNNYADFDLKIGYTPDVAWGYGNRHAIWFEIKNTNPSSINKISFCQLNNITLLEIDASQVMNYDGGILEFTNLTLDTDVDDYFKKMERKINNKIDKIINKDGYILHTELRRLLRNTEFQFDGLDDKYDNVCSRYELTLIDGDNLKYFKLLYKSKNTGNILSVPHVVRKVEDYKIARKQLDKQKKIAQDERTYKKVLVYAKKLFDKQKYLYKVDVGERINKLLNIKSDKEKYLSLLCEELNLEVIDIKNKKIKEVVEDRFKIDTRKSILVKIGTFNL